LSYRSRAAHAFPEQLSRFPNGSFTPAAYTRNAVIAVSDARDARKTTRGRPTVYRRPALPVSRENGVAPVTVCDVFGRVNVRLIRRDPRRPRTYYTRGTRVFHKQTLLSIGRRRKRRTRYLTNDNGFRTGSSA